MSKRRALLILHPSLGHINAVRKLVKCMKKKYELAICGAAIGKENMDQFNVKTYLLYSMPFGSGFENQLCREEQNKYLCELAMRRSMTLFKKRISSIENILNDWVPTFVFIDILYITDIILIENWFQKDDCKIYLIRTKPALSNNKFTVPSTYRIEYHSEFYSRLLWFYFNISKIVMRFWNYIKFQGYDNLSILIKVRRILFNSVMYPKIKWLNEIGIQIENYIEFVLLPSEFEFGFYKPLRKEKYIGFQYKIKDQKFDNEIYKLLDELQLSRTHGRRIISISFGSLYMSYKNKIMIFLTKLKEAFNELDEQLHVVFIGKIKLNKIIFSSNILFTQIDKAPIYNILNMSDLHISHGGINTIKDCIFSKTPMLLVPLSKRWDQPGNAAKVEYHGIGKAISFRISKRKLINKISWLLERYDPQKFDKIINIENNKYGEKTLWDLLP